MTIQLIEEDLDLWSCQITSGGTIGKLEQSHLDSLLIQTTLPDCADGEDYLNYTFLMCRTSGFYVRTADLKRAIDAIAAKQEELRRDAE